MSESTDRVKHPYPSKNEDPWYKSFENFVDSLDSADFAARENFNLSFVGGGNISIDNTGFVTWTDDIYVHHKSTGQKGKLLDSSQSGIDTKNNVSGLDLNDGQVAYSTLVRNPQNDYTLSLNKTNGTVPSNDRAVALFYRQGNYVWVHGIGVFNLGGGNTKPRGATDYLVGPTSAFPFSDIQNAINQASFDGATTSDPALVHIYPGTYTGDVDMKGGIHVVGLGEGNDRSVTIDGKVTCEIAFGGDVLLENVNVENSGTAIDVSGVDAAEYWIQDSRFYSSSNDAASIINTGPSDIQFHDCIFETEDSSSYGLVADESSTYLRDCEVTNITSIDNGGVHITGGTINAEFFNINGQLDVDSGSINADTGGVETDTVSAIDIDSNGSVDLDRFNLTSNNNPVVSGSGSYSYSVITYGGNQEGLSSNLNSGAGGVDGEKRIQVAQGAIYDNTSSGLSSDNVQDAIDEVASSTPNRTVEYWVGPDQTYEYQSIQNAIDQAVNDGRDSTSPGIVVIAPDTYNENLSLKNNVHLAALEDSGESGVIVNGQITCNLSTGTNSTKVSVRGLDVTYDSGAAFVFSGSNAQEIYMKGCSIYAKQHTAMDLQNTNSGSFCHFEQIEFRSDNSGSDVVSHEGSSEALFQLCEFFHSNGTGESALRSANPADTEVEYCSLLGQVLVDDSATVRIENSYIESSSNPILETVSSGDIELYQIIAKTTSSPSIVNNGSGTVYQSLVSYDDSNAGGLSGTGNFSRPLLERLLIAFNPANTNYWTTNPDTVQEALNTLASMLNTTNNSLSDKIDKDGSVTFIANQSMGDNKITDVNDPTNDKDAANKRYVQNTLNQAITDTNFKFVPMSAVGGSDKAIGTLINIPSNIQMKVVQAGIQDENNTIPSGLKLQVINSDNGNVLLDIQTKYDKQQYIRTITGNKDLELAVVNDTGSLQVASGYIRVEFDTI